MTFDRSWQARWIWFNEAVPPPATMFNLDPLVRPADTIGRFRRSFDLPDVPASAACRITADGRYQLFVNGVRVGRGPIRSEPSHLAWDEYDVAPFLREGQNTIAVLARHFGVANPYWKPAHAAGEVGFGGLLLECTIGDATIVTDDEWRASLAPYARANPGRWAGPPAVEILDARADDPSWALPDFDDAAWQHVRVLTPVGLGMHRDTAPFDPFSMLDRAEIGALTEREVTPSRIVGRGDAFRTDAIAPIDCRPNDGIGRPADEAVPASLSIPTGRWVTFDFGAITNSHPILHIDATPGTVIDLAVGEDLDEHGQPVIRPRRWVMRYIASGSGDEVVEALEPVGFRYLQVLVRQGDVRTVSASALYRHYPRPAGASFSCDDATLDDLWRVGAQTLDACSVDAFLDCPGREQRAWMGDAYVESLVSLVCNPDTGLVRHNAELLRQGVRSDGLRPMVGGGDFADSLTTIPDFSLHWVRTVARAQEHIDEVAFVEQMWPRVLDALAWFEWHRDADDLLVDLTGWIFVDWAQTERGRNVAAIDALYAMALDDAASMADQLGDAGTAVRFRARADRSREAFERYWDEERGVYVDAASPDGWTGRRVSQQTNALAILSGAAPRERWDGMLSRILDTQRLLETRNPGDGGPEVDRLLYHWATPEPFGGGDPMDEEEQVVLAQPFFCHFLHQALAEAGAIDELFASMRRWQALVERGDEVLHEYWDHVPGHGSRCHAWSATPTWDLTTHVAGVKRRTVGWSEVDIAPNLGPLNRVEATVPTPRGEIRVELRRGEGGTVILPEGMTGTFHLGDTVVDLVAGKQDVPA